MEEKEVKLVDRVVYSTTINATTEKIAQILKKCTQVKLLPYTQVQENETRVQQRVIIRIES